MQLPQSLEVELDGPVFQEGLARYQQLAPREADTYIDLRIPRQRQARLWGPASRPDNGVDSEERASEGDERFEIVVGCHLKDLRLAPRPDTLLEYRETILYLSVPSSTGSK